MKLLRALAALICFGLCSLLASAQATLTVSGTKVKDEAQNALTGTATFTVTDISDTPVTYTPQGGSPTTAVFTINLVSGAVQNSGGFPPTIANPATIVTPANTRYRITLANSAGVVTYTLPLTNISTTNGNYSLDSYSVSAGITVTGNGIPHLPCAPTAMYNDTTQNNAYPWVCSNLQSGDGIYWTQNPSLSPTCGNPSQAVASAINGTSTFCTSSTNAYATPGLVLGSPAAGAPGQIALVPAIGSSFTLTRDKIAAVGQLQNDISGNAGTATALAAAGTGCTVVNGVQQVSTGIDAKGNSSCVTPQASAPVSAQPYHLPMANPQGNAYVDSPLNVDPTSTLAAFNQSFAVGNSLVATPYNICYGPNKIITCMGLTDPSDANMVLGVSAGGAGQKLMRFDQYAEPGYSVFALDQLNDTFTARFPVFRYYNFSDNNGPTGYNTNFQLFVPTIIDTIAGFTGDSFQVNNGPDGNGTTAFHVTQGQVRGTANLLDDGQGVSYQNCSTGSWGPSSIAAHTCSTISVLDYGAGFYRAPGDQYGVTGRNLTFESHKQGLSVADQIEVNFVGGGDNQIQSIAATIRCALLDPADEGCEAYRLQYLMAIPWVASLVGASDIANGQTSAGFTGMGNPGSIGAGFPVVNVTTQHTLTATGNDGVKTITVESGNAQSGFNTSPLTPSVNGTLAATIAAPAGVHLDQVPLINAQVTIASLTAGQDCVLSGDPGQGVGGVEKLHVFSVSGSAPNFTAGIYPKMFHGQNAHFNCAVAGSETGNMVGTTNQTYAGALDDFPIWVTGNTASAVTVGYTAYGDTRAYLPGGTLTFWQAADVVSTAADNGSYQAGGQMHLAKSNMQMNVGDFFVQQNPFNENIDMFHTLTTFDNPLATYTMHSENLQTTGFALQGVWTHLYLPTGSGMALFEISNSGGIIWDGVPNPSSGGGNCAGTQAAICYAGIGTGRVPFLSGATLSNGFVNFGIDGSTGRWYLDGAGLDMAGFMTMFEDTQSGYGEQYQNVYGGGPTANNLSVSFGGNGNPWYGRNGYAQGPSLVQGVTAHPIANATLAALIHDSWYHEYNAQPEYWIGDYTDANASVPSMALTYANSLGFLNVSGAISTRDFIPTSSTLASGSTCGSHPANALWADDGFIYHCNAAGTTAERAQLEAF